MKQRLLNLLKRLEQVIAPPQFCHHVITYAQYGSDARGWEDRLALQVSVEGELMCFFLDDEDLQKDPDEFAEMIYRAAVDGSTCFQRGVAVGQYHAPEAASMKAKQGEQSQ